MHRPFEWKKKKIFLICGIVLIIILVYLGYSYARYQYLLGVAVNQGNPSNISIVIKKGDSVSTIAKNLGQKDLIVDEDTFKTYAKWSGFDRKIVAGRFLLNQTMTIPQIVGKISDLNQGQIVLTVPEGSTIKDIDQKLFDLGIGGPGEFIQAVKDFDNYSKYPFLDASKMQQLPHALEGYLFPDTYFIDPGSYNPQNLIDIMLKNFQKKISTDNLWSDQDGKSLYDTITMASIVEKEVRTDQDRPIVAGILWKRLEKHWQLGADATLLYLKDDNTINYSDLQDNSPYNTRKMTGLPPGPICNPGIKSIIAALNPQSSPYFYYLTRSDTGEVIYAQTNDEQNANRAKYLQ